MKTIHNGGRRAGVGQLAASGSSPTSLSAREEGWSGRSAGWRVSAAYSTIQNALLTFAL